MAGARAAVVTPRRGTRAAQSLGGLGGLTGGLAGPGRGAEGQPRTADDVTHPHATHCGLSSIRFASIHRASVQHAALTAQRAVGGGAAAWHPKQGYGLRMYVGTASSAVQPLLSAAYGVRCAVCGQWEA